MSKKCSPASQNIFEVLPKNDQVIQSTQGDLLEQIITTTNLLREEIVVIVLPAIILNSPSLLNSFLQNIATLSSCGARIVIVHDHSEAVTQTLTDLGVSLENFAENQFSDHKLANIIEMVLSGHINKKIIAALGALGVNAIGISGKDGNLISAVQRPRKATKKNVINFGFVAEPVMVNPEILLNLLDSEMVVVLSPIASCDNGSTNCIDVLLTSAVLAASVTAGSLIIARAGGALKYEEQIVNECDQTFLKILQKATPANDPSRDIIDIAISALENCIETVQIIDATQENSLLHSIFFKLKNTTIAKF